MGRAPAAAGATAFRFTAREVTEMEKALESSKGSTPARAVVASLAENFSTNAERAGQKPIQSKQVWNWFQNRRHAQKAKIAKSPEKLKAVAVTVPDSSQPKKVPAPSTAVPSGARSRSDAHQMEFEAKSARDGAWYDVSTFISHRLAPSGDPEVRVRFAGFGSEEDEWVNVRSAVRQRSLPCEASECVAVLAGDLILCFQEGNEQALYFDADILDVQRRRHDVRGCRCRFWVRYRHDLSEEVVPLRKVCRRPETEYRLLKLQSYGKNPVMVADVSQAATKSEPSPSVPAAKISADGASSTVVKGLEPVIPAAIPATMHVGVSAVPVGVSAVPVGVSAVPVGVSAVPVGVSAVPVGVSAVPVGVSTVPVEVPAVPVGVSAMPVEAPAVPVGVSTVPVEAVAVPVGVSATDTSSAMDIDATPVNAAAELVKNIKIDAAEQNPGASQIVDFTTKTTQENAGVVVGVGSMLPAEIISEPAKISSVNEAPSLKAPPEMFDSESESIVVLDRSDLEGISKS